MRRDPPAATRSFTGVILAALARNNSEGRVGYARSTRLQCGPKKVAGITAAIWSRVMLPRSSTE
jgi:hypothetical protein